MMDSPRLARLSPEEKRALLARLLQKKLGQKSTPIPLSLGQRALWFLHRLDPDSAAYNLHFCARIRSPLDVEALRRTLQTILDRHAVLRTTFVEQPDGPVQLVHDGMAPALDVIDVAGWPDEQMHRALEAEAHRPFALDQGPVLRTRLFRRGEFDNVVLLTVHHIVSDFWTLGVLMDELRTLYPAAVAGVESPLSPPAGHYADFVRWQQELLQGPEGERLWDYWRQALSGELPALNLPTDHPRPTVQSDRGSAYRFRLDPDLVERVRELARGEGATLFAVLLAAYQSLLHRLTGQDDVLVGTPVAGRSRPEFASVVGYFVNMIVLRGRLESRPTFRQFLSQVRQTLLDGLHHGDFPFAQLVERLQPARDLSRHALFQAAFVLKRSQAVQQPGSNGAEGHWRFGSLVLEPVELDHQAVPFDCNLMLEETGDSLAGVLEYNTDLFDAATVARWMECFRVLLEEAVADPDRPIAQLPLLSPEDRAAVLRLGNGRTVARPETPLHRLIEEQVARTPNAPALTFDGESLSYAELNRRANVVAHYLRSLGAGADVPIAICLERSFEMVIGLLAVLKAGAAYVPLDPDWPRERLELLLKELRPPAVLTLRRHAAHLPAAPAQVVALDADAPAEITAGDANPAADVRPEHLAYIIYTSGSTGTPKGCANTHRGIVNRLLWMQSEYRLDASDCVVQKTPYSFDVSVWEFFWPLMTGARLVIARPGGQRDADYLAQLIAGEGATVVHFVPSMLQVFLQAERLNACRSLRDVICSGEALSWELQEQFFERFPRVRLHNLYGPTEAAVDVTYWRCDPADARRIVPIGRPVDNTQVYVLDERLEPMPLGVPGEIYIGGVQLARGYWQRPEMTAERFVASPFAAGERLYKTGDLGRVHPDGAIEYLGRLDHQIKIRGYRIELGEIEAVLKRHAAVGDTVVVARQEGGTPRLVAYVVPATKGDAPSAVDLRTFLGQQLPEYMVPAAFVNLDALPLSANGKIDRRALPAPDTARPELSSTYVAPRTPTEVRLAAIWSAVLQVERVGVFDSFFELGGHSLLATQVVTRIRTEFGADLPLRRFFEAPTLAEISSAIDEQSGRSGIVGMAAAPLRPAPRDQPLPMSFGQETLWFLDQLVPGNTTYNIPAVVRLTGPLDLEAIRKSFEAIVHRHESLRSTFALHNDRQVVIVRDPEPMPMEIIDLRDLPADEREAKAKQLAGIESRKSFSLAHGPLLRLSVIRLADHDHLVLMTVHHIAFDGWSTGVLVSEFAAYYRGFVSGEAVKLPALPIQFPDFAYWQRRWQEDGRLDDQLDYWKKQLAGIPPLLALPTDRPRPQVWTFRGDQFPLHFPPSLVADLKALSKRQGCTLFMTLLAAFQTLLHRYSGMDDICIGSPIANRNRAEIEGLIGFVVNTLVLRGNFSGNPTFSELLRRTREMAFGAYTHQDLPFERLMKAVMPHRDARHSSLFQVLFVLQNSPVHIPPLPGLSHRLVLDGHNGTAKFDLSLGLTEMPDGLLGVLEYNCDLFDRSTAERMGMHFRRLLEAVVIDANVRIADLPLLTSDEQSRMLAAGEGDKVEVPPGCFHRRFEAQVRSVPDAEAVVWGEERVSYGELNRRANQLARELRRRGVAPETVVGLCFDRSVEMVVALLAVLKAGGGYLPLDPALPRERLAVILDDAQPLVLITQERLAADLPFDSARIIRMDADAEQWSAQPETDLPDGAGPENIAYIIYTSGSTGTPKGCVMENASLDNAFVGWQVAYCLDELHAYLQMANFAFDVFTADMVRALGSGGKLVLCPTETLLDPEKLLELIRKEEIDYAEFVPAVVRPVLRHLEATRQNLAPVRLVVVGSDVWYGGEYRRLRRALGPRTRLVNSYGLTEATIDNMYYDGSDAELADEGAIPIGRPYANQYAYVLDPNLHVQPIGVPGELHVGGAALARGYLNRPELTAEKFIPDPFRPGQRLYKSGDLARLLPNGQIELLGRTDHQVKIRGFRIELGEIETTLGQHPAVRDCVVVARDDGRGTKRLIAYLVLVADGPTPSANDLRGFLSGKLPEYMVPAVFVPLPALPLSPNGKVDRNALPAPEAGRGELAAEYIAPVTPTEIKLAEVWADVLRIERVGQRDSFFELGGHSLSATQVLARVRARFDVELPLRKLFEAPILADFAALIDVAEQAKHGPAFESRPAQERGILSHAQMRLWFLDQLEPGNPVYHVATAVRLHGSLDRGIWEKCFLDIGARHDILRTTFPAENGMPFAAVAPSVALNVRDVDLSECPAEHRDERVQAEALAEYSRPFNLARGPLFRIALVKLTDQEHILLLTMHHIVADGGSLGVFLSELAAAYTHLTAGQPSPLSPLPIQYADFARWQQKWLEGGERDRQWRYWRSRLADAPLALDLPTDRPRPPIQSSHGATQTRVLPPALADAIHTMSAREGVTSYMTMLATFEVLLHRYSGQDDLLLGTPVSNRNRVEVERLIGCFVNTLVLRSEVRGNLSFREKLTLTREDVMQALAHQDLPFESLVDSLQPRRDPSRTPLFQVMFAWQAAPTALQLPGLFLQTIPIDHGTAMFDLTLVVTEDDGQMSVSAEYNTDLYDPTTIARMLMHYERLLARFTSDPSLAVASAPINDEAEQRRMLVEWNATALDYPRDRTVVDAIAEIAAARPEAIAVEDATGGQLTYGELNRRADALAARLAESGAGPASIVGLLAGRSLDMAVGLLGILKSGAAYLPLDPSYPAERLRFMADDAGLNLLVAERGGEFAGEFGGKVVFLDEQLPDATAETHAARPENAAYVIYTSGSTGMPKGVVVTHRNLMAMCAGVRERYGLVAADRILQFTVLSFDVAAEEIFPAWTLGATVVLRPDGPVAGAQEFLQFVADRRISVLELPTSYWHELTAAIAGERFELAESLRLVVVGGEAARPDMAARWRDVAGHKVRWINAYGPTETTVTSITFEPSTKETFTGATVPIGRPLGNSRAYVLDRAGDPAPIGLPGELYIAGESVARGYLNRPELTAERFVPDPFSGGTMYRTGDRARWRADGNLEFLGRSDEQVKVRGFRIEPGEIEAVLAAHPGVREAAVVASAGGTLVAYFVPDAQHPANADEILSHLQQRLPEYMLPAAHIAMSELPMTRSGKIDRRALAAREPALAERGREYIAPRTATEERIAEAWSGLINAEKIGAEDNFYDLGGNSLLAVQLAARLSRAFGRSIPVKAIVLFPTVAALADAIDRNKIGAEHQAWDGATAAAAENWLATLGPQFHIERRPLDELIAAGELPPVQAAAIGYLPSALLAVTGLSAEAVIHGWCGNRPIVSGIYDLPLGRIATILIPRFDSQLYQDSGDLVAALDSGLALASRLGAEHVSLTGLLPSATDYGRAVGGPATRDDRPRVTTGHGSTTAAVVLSIRRLLAESERNLQRERVAFLGLGSIGAAVLRLMLRTLPHPAEIVLCDLYSKRTALEALRDEIRSAGFSGRVSVAEARGEVPDEVYDATFFVGATNVPDILDIDRLRAGSLIVDDSAPHCFRTESAIRRLRTRGDILFTEGGTLRGPEAMNQWVYVAPELEPVVRAMPRDFLPVFDDRQITGCILSSLLSARFEELSPTIGLIDSAIAVAHYQKLTELGYDAAPLHCDSYVLDESAVSHFRDRFRDLGVPDSGPRLAAGEFDWFAETQLSPEITAAGLPAPRDGDPDSILLTGATGFLGAFLLDELLRETTAHIVCLARASSDEEALQRIRRNLDQYSIDIGGHADRIVPVAGDLAEPRLGLGETRFQRLASAIDVIYHNGAQVHFLHPYATLKNANVLGTQEVLRLATTVRTKPVQFVSTLSVIAGVSHGRLALEIDRNDRPDLLENGYAQSKWVAERLVWAAMERGVPASIFRPGRIIWHSRTGALNQDDVFTRALRACIQLAALPAVDATLEMTPVDYVSRAIVALGRRRSASGRAYHVFNRQFVRLQQLLDWVRAAGYALEILPAEQWLARVQQSAGTELQDALAGLMPLLANGVPFLTAGGEPSAIPGPNIDDANTQAALAGSGVESPAVGPAVVGVYLQRLVSDGLLAPAEGTAKKRPAAVVNGRTHKRTGRSHTHSK